MVGANKILTVSYGTFSCTLEGFDDPFSTMKAIAEYFRDLAAEDRYFGAEPPTPDAEMLHRIAEREIQRRVEAKIQQNGLVLRAADTPAPVAVPAAAVQAPAPVAVVPAAVAEAPVVQAAPVEIVAQAPVRVVVPAPLPAAEVAPVPVAPVQVAEPTPVSAPAIEVIEPALSRTVEIASEPEAAVAEAPAAEAAPVEEPVEINTAAKLLRIRAAVARAQSATESSTAPVMGEDYDEDSSVTAFRPSAPADFGYALDSDGIDIAALAVEMASEREEAAAPVTAPATAVADILAEELPEEPEAALVAEASPESEAPVAAPAVPATPVEVMTVEVPAKEAEADFAEALATVTALSAEAEAEVAEDDDLPLGLSEHLDLVAEAPEIIAPADEDFADARIDADNVVARLSHLLDSEEDDEEFFAAEDPAEDEPRAFAAEDTDADDEPADAGLADDALIAALVAAETERATLQPQRVRTVALRDAPEEVEEDDSAESEFAEDAELARVLPPHPVEVQAEAAEAVALEVLATETPAETARDRSGRDILVPAPGAEDHSLDRLLNVTDAEMQDEDNRRRVATIAHMKAAVAQNEADREAGGVDAAARAGAEAIDRYRADLAQAVRPRRPALPGQQPRTARPEPMVLSARPAGERPAPLVLVSEQRVDKPAPAAGVIAPVAPIRPRRVSSASIAHNLDIDEEIEVETSEDEEEDGNVFRSATSFAEFAEKMGAHDMPELLEAAAAYYAGVEGRPHFSRPLLLRTVSSLEGMGMTREEGLRSFGTLLRSGRIQKLRRGQFTLAEDSHYMEEARRLTP